MLGPQARKLSPPQTGEPCHQDQRPVPRIDRVGQTPDLLSRQKPHLLPGRFRKRDAACGIASDHARVLSLLENPRQHPVGVSHRPWPDSPSDQFGDPLLDVSPLYAAERRLANHGRMCNRSSPS